MKQMLGHAVFLFPALFVLGYVWAACKFCKKYLGTSRKKEWLFLFFSFGGSLLLDIAVRRYSVPYIFSVVLCPVFFMGFVVLLFQSDKGRRILAASMLMLNIRVVGNFCDSFLSCSMLFFRHTLKMIPEPFLSEWELSLISCVSYCFVILSVRWMSKHLESVFRGKSGKWYVILAAPLFMLIAVMDAAKWGAGSGIMVRSGGTMGLYYDQMFSHAGCLILTLLSASAAGFYVFGMERIYLEQEKSSRYHSQIAVYQMLTDQYRQSERLRHDMKNHIIALSGLYQNQEWEKIGAYLRNLEDSSLDTAADMTGNKAVDAILYQKRKRAETETIRWECDVQMPKKCGMDEFDLCILFGNLLDNALEACERMSGGECRFINIQARAVKKCFLLEIKNSMNKEETEERQKEQGIGLLNVKDVVDRYHGAVNMEAREGIFLISILIPLNDIAHDIKTAV